MELFGTKSTKQKTHQNNNVPIESIQDNTFKNFEKSSLPKLDGTKNGTKKRAKSTKQKTQNYFHKNNTVQINNNSNISRKKCETGTCLVHKSTKQPPQKYICVFCEYQTGNKSNYNKHLSTKRHQNNVPRQKSQRSHHICVDCGKSYLYASGLWKHQKKCMNSIVDQQITPVPVQSDKDIIKLIMEENASLIRRMLSSIKICRNKTTNIMKIYKRLFPVWAIITIIKNLILIFFLMRLVKMR